jgi:pimeloyl-ACP methyl ester carboxylesterase/LmbE family N-acetylglucosaminyl deacetylase
MGITTILSPHIDDAVLSVWGVLTGPGEVGVINVFDGVPAGERAIGWWDRLTCAADPHTRARERHAEDREALALAGRTATSLGFVDAQYRAGEPDLEALVERIAQAVPRASAVLAPAALGEHPDHRATRAAALALRERGLEVALYADVPHATPHGWPAWVTGAWHAPDADATTQWDRVISEGGLSAGELAPQVRALAPDELARKREAVACYRTQLSGLEVSFPSFSGPQILGYEVVWALAPHDGRARRNGGIRQTDRRSRVASSDSGHLGGGPAGLEQGASPRSSRAVAPVRADRVELDGVGVAYETFGSGSETVLLLPPWSIVHSRFWKAQVAYLARHFRVVTFDAVGNGRSDRPTRAEDYALERDVDNALAVLEAAQVERWVMVAHCAAAPLGLLLGAHHADGLAGAVFMSPALPLTPPLAERTGFDFESELPEYEGWAKKNRNYWQHDFHGFLEFFFSRCFTEPHSSKQIEDSIGWALDGTADTLALTVGRPDLDLDAVHELIGRLSCPLLVTQGDEDALIPPDRGIAFAAATGAELVQLTGVGHCPQARYPVHFNLIIRDFAERCFGSPGSHTGRARGSSRAVLRS